MASWSMRYPGIAAGVVHLVDSYMLLTWQELARMAHCFIVVEGPLGKLKGITGPTGNLFYINGRLCTLSPGT